MDGTIMEHLRGENTLKGTKGAQSPIPLSFSVATDCVDFKGLAAVGKQP